MITALQEAELAITWYKNREGGKIDKFITVDDILTTISLEGGELPVELRGLGEIERAEVMYRRLENGSITLEDVYELLRNHARTMDAKERASATFH
jgi:hypothetical protein